jgi:hypothetical protein
MEPEGDKGGLDEMRREIMSSEPAVKCTVGDKRGALDATDPPTTAVESKAMGLRQRVPSLSRVR